ncbi:MAG: acyl-CoA thioesterase [Alloprevotella sp.]|nr:acyl-CoA thioesterase [Alloprevotella sp.]
MIQPTDEQTYRHNLDIQIRFNDVDRLGHVNNNAYFSYYDLGKVDYFNQVFHLYTEPNDILPVVVNINADFYAPVFGADDIVMQTTVSHIGKKSFTLEQRAVNRKSGQTVCHCRTVMVCFSLKNNTSVEVPEDFRRAICTYEQKEL